MLALAFAAQCATDLLTATARETLGRGIAPSVQLRVIGNVYLIDACLTPVGLLIAMACAAVRSRLLLALPLLALLAVLADDRRMRMREAIGRLDELTAEHARLDRAVHRIGEAFASKLDRAALADIMVRTAVESLGAGYGRAHLASGVVEHGEEAPRGRRRRRGRSAPLGQLRVVTSGDEAAMAQPLTGGAWAASTEVLTVMRHGAPFTTDEQALFGYLAQQTAVALENVALHDQLRRQATVDEVTGLSNHRRFQEALAHELARMRRSERPTALALIDIDSFKTINDTHGHRNGDAVLQLVADTLTQICRSTDEPARYGGDELAVILAETGPRRRAHDRREHPPRGRGRRAAAARRDAAAGDGERRRERARARPRRPRGADRGRRRRPLRGQAHRQEQGAQRRLGGERARRRRRPLRAPGARARGTKRRARLRGLLPSAPSCCRSLVCLVLGLVLLASAVLKLVDRQGTQSALATYGIRRAAPRRLGPDRRG